MHQDATGRIGIVRRPDFTRDDCTEATCQEHAKILCAMHQGAAARVG